MTVLVPGTIRPASVLLVGEAPGEQEERLRQVFIGASGRELDALLSDVGLKRHEVALTNVFDRRPPNNSLIHWSASKKDAESERLPGLPWAAIQSDTAKYVRACFVQPALQRLQKEILSVEPNIIVALGNTALAALTGVSGIGKVRGSLYLSHLLGGYRAIGDRVISTRAYKVLPTYHPAAILRQYELRPMAEADLLKARAESGFPELRLRTRRLHLEPTIDEAEAWAEALASAPALAVDCETKNQQITCIGFADSPESAYVIPFWDRRQLDWSYWKTPEEEVRAYKAVARVLASPAVKILQNGLYDLQYFLRYGWTMKNFSEDTMIKHHSLYPGLPKGLDFLGSLYATERAWKKFRPRGGEEKADA